MIPGGAPTKVIISREVELNTRMSPVCSWVLIQVSDAFPRQDTGVSYLVGMSEVVGYTRVS